MRLDAAYAALGVVLVLTTLATLRPGFLGGSVAPLSALTGMVVEWFAPQLITLAGVVSAGAAGLGAVASPLGRFGLAAHAVCALALGRYVRRVHRSLPLLDGRPVGEDDAPFPLAGEPRAAGPFGVRWLPMFTLRTASMLDVEVERDVVFREVGGVRLRLDVYRPRRRDGALPAVLYVHGGGWILGTRRQSRFMMYELAAAGFAVFAISYRLAPRFPLPHALEDAKLALAWVHAHAAEYGADGARVAVVGGSAGGHLAAMLALTQGDPAYAGGLEGADTRVSGAVILYGAAELTRALEKAPRSPLAAFLEHLVFRRRYRDAPELFRRVDPILHARKDAPPMLLVHGDLDLLVPIEVSRRFTAALRERGAADVYLLEVPHAHHAFELFPTPVHQRAVRVISAFLAWLEARPPARPAA